MDLLSLYCTVLLSSFCVCLWWKCEWLFKFLIHNLKTLFLPYELPRFSRQFKTNVDVKLEDKQYFKF